VQSIQKTKLLSVVVTNYNKPTQQIEECIRSILNQTVLPGEIIFVDDGSESRPTHRACTSIVLARNHGVAYARDIGVRMSTGKLLLFVDADDKLSPDFIQQCGKVIAKSDIVYPDLILFGEGMQNMLVENPKKLRAKDILAHKLSIPVTSMMRRTVYEELGGFRELPVFEDWDFWIRAMAGGYRFNKAQTLLHYRQQLDSRIRNNANAKKETHDLITKNYVIKDGKICLKTGEKETTSLKKAP
jgi:glycosyltransferase involved in cell wall biosynthesis